MGLLAQKTQKLLKMIWNKLPSECKLEDNPNKFKHKIKEEFFKNIQRENDDIYIYY